MSSVDVDIEDAVRGSGEGADGVEVVMNENMNSEARTIGAEGERTGLLAGRTTDVGASGEHVANRSAGERRQSGNRGDDGGFEDDRGMSLQEILYGASSFHAIATPVTITMTLAAMAVIYINTEQTVKEGEEALAQAYTVFDTGSNNADSTTGRTLGLSLVNAFIIVCVIGAMTFVIVLLYKYRCMKCLVGYMMFSSAMLLGLLGGVMFTVGIDKYGINIDKATFSFALYNFALVGTISIFFQLGVPTTVTQFYLVVTSVILAWQLSHFDEWTAWTLLVMLALYDLCAVLTPCGPLKALVNLMQREDAPEMPGLLYEAQLPSHARRPGGGRISSASGARRGDTSSNTPNAPSASASASENSGTATSEAPTAPTAEATTTSDSAAATQTNEAANQNGADSGNVASSSATEGGNSDPERSSDGDSRDQRIGSVPRAVAYIYRLRIVPPDDTTNEDGATASTAAGERSGRSSPSVLPLLQHVEGESEGEGNSGSGATPASSSPNDMLTANYTASQLREEVRVLFPRNGGRIDTLQGRDGKTRYLVKNRHGNVVRVLLVDRRGRVFEEVTREGEVDDSDDDGGRANSIKLGLGDFIFYSVLVGKAAMYSFTTFAACTLVILAGLGGTLVLLAVFHQALPALPISIFLGVTFYLLTRIVIEPWLHEVLQSPFYV